jgi:crotonobetainyl-CoA:carnitine CoA-transferase CaiB-like acyl-CoA transferase
VVACLTPAANASGPQVIQLSPSDAYGLLTVDSITQAMVDGENVTRTSRHPQAQIFVAECACGSGLTVQNSSSQEFWIRFATALGRLDLTRLSQFLTYHDRVRNYFALEEIVCAEMSRRTASEWEQILEAADVPFSPFLTSAQAIALPQVSALALEDSDCVPSGNSLLRPLRFNGERPTSHTRSPLS